MKISKVEVFEYDAAWVHGDYGMSRMALVMASAAAGLPAPVDGVSTDVHDIDAVAADTRESLAAGYTARLCIHPDQVPPIHLALAPSEADLRWAHSVLDPVAEGPVAVVDGRMVDQPVLLRARRIEARAALHSPTRTS